MAISYTLRLKQKNGQIEITSAQFEGPSVAIGRSETAEIRLTDPLVSFEHAALLELDGSLYIEDRNSFSGTKVNEKLITRKSLNFNDVIQIGPFSFTVLRDAHGWNLLEERSLAHHPAEEVYVQDVTRALDYKNAFPSMRLLSLLLALALLIIFFLLPLNTDKLQSWNSGPISNQHHTLNNDCRACHTVPFKRVADESCMSCHNMSDHADTLGELHEKHRDLKVSCASCHMEHNGSEGLIVRDANLCSSCHGSLTTLLPDTKLLDVNSLADHPQFHIAQQLPDGKTKKVSLDKKGELRDTNPLKLNHKVHLTADLLGSDGPVTLTCDSCHKPSLDKRSFLPITFENECQSCHPLALSDSASTAEVPHTEPNLLYQHLRKYYSELLLEKEGKEDDKKSSRKIPGSTVTRAAALEFKRKQVESQARTTEDQIFNKTACIVCHQISEDSSEQSQQTSKFKIEAPNTPHPWFRAALFDHDAHGNITCESCHKGVADSELTSDVLLPGIQSCQSCHHDTATDNAIATDCLTCHSFHEQKPLAANKKIELK